MYVWWPNLSLTLAANPYDGSMWKTQVADFGLKLVANKGTSTQISPAAQGGTVQHGGLWLLYIILCYEGQLVGIKAVGQE